MDLQGKDNRNMQGNRKSKTSAKPVNLYLHQLNKLGSYLK